MGASCGCDGENKKTQSVGATPDIRPERKPEPKKRVKFVESVSDETADYDSVDPSSATNGTDYRSGYNTDNDGGYDSSAGGLLEHTKEAQDEAIEGFKEAIQKGDEKTVMYYVDEFSEIDLFNISFENGDNCLQVAVRNSASNLIYYLLTNGLSPDSQNEKNGETALHTAVRTRDLKVVTVLSKYRADANVKNKKGETALDIAEANDDHDIVELLAPDTQEMILSRLGSVDAKSASNLPMPNNAKLGDDQSGKKYSVKVSAPNAFSALKRDNTRQALGGLQEIQDNKSELPILEGWLEKKSTSMGRGYQKRWVAVTGQYMLWSEWQREIFDIDVTNAKERKKWNNSINLMTIKEVESVTEGKSQRKFKLLMDNSGNKKSKRKEYLWKCMTKEDRDLWVNGLKKHIAHMKDMLNYMSNK